MENLSGAFDQEEWEYHNVKRGEEEMTDAERDEWEARECAYWLGEFQKGKLDNEYSDYILANCAGDRIICNGDSLIGAMESNYLLDEFIRSKK